MDRYAFLALLAWLLLAAPWVWSFRGVEAYMDEIFHVPQTRQYCQGNFRDWDPKITTLPGLYLLGAALPRLLSLLEDPGGAELSADHRLCSLAALRAQNVVYGAGCLLLLGRLLGRRMGRGKAAAHALVLALYPIHFFYTFLYYTDVGSLFWVLLTHHLATPSADRPVPSFARIACASASAAVAIVFRQTNAVWVMFTFGTAVLADLQTSDKWGLQADGLSPTMILNFALGMLQERRRLLSRFGLLLLPVCLFVVFVVKNGSIVVGDHANHKAVAHWAQLAYLSAATVSMWGLLGPQAGLSVASLKAFAAARLGGGLRAAAGTVLGVGGVAWLLRRYSFAHPFLLADNRHYTFYVWSRFLGRVPGLKEALAPAYLYAAWVCRRRLSSSQSELWFLIWCVACVLTLVPAHLLEPRYWTVALVMAHAHGPEQPWIALASIGAACLAVNVATLAVFCHRPFAWSSGEVARFMW